MYLVIDDATSSAAVVDPYDAVKIGKALKENNVEASHESDWLPCDSS